MDDDTRRSVRRPLIRGAVLILLSFLVLLLPGAPRSLWPALVALLMVFATRVAHLSLFTACLCGVVLLLGDSGGTLFAEWVNPESGGLRSALLGPWHLGAIVFTLLLGAFAAVIERGGGLLPLLRAEGGDTPSSRRRFLTRVYGLGLLCFFDGLANALMIGRVSRPAADRLKVPRAFLAYLVDTTSSAVACLAFISTWIAVQLSLIGEGVKGLPLPGNPQPYLLFLQSVPRNFYCLFALLLAFLALRRNWLIGPMRLRSATREPESARHARDEAPVSILRALVPLGLLLGSIPVFMYIFHFGEGVPPRLPLSLEKIQSALGSNSGPPAFVVGSALALLAAIVAFPGSRRRETPSIALGGARQLLPALLVLLLAWVLGSILSALGTAAVLAGGLGDWLPVGWFPAGVFVLGCLTSFVSGTSWGTMGILMPLVLPTVGGMAEVQGVTPEVLATVVPAVIAAVFGGAVFGDHCSPYSDTTIVSALATGITTPEHTVTQLPYALLAAAVALVAGYLPLALGLSHWGALLLGAGLLVGLLSLPRGNRQ